jgi:hypothetical protein
MESLYGNLRKNCQLKFKVIRRTKNKINRRARELGYIHTANYLRDLAVKDIEKGKQEQKMVMFCET